MDLIDVQHTRKLNCVLSVKSKMSKKYKLCTGCKTLRRLSETGKLGCMCCACARLWLTELVILQTEHKSTQQRFASSKEEKIARRSKEDRNRIGSGNEQSERLSRFGTCLNCRNEMNTLQAWVEKKLAANVTLEQCLESSFLTSAVSCSHVPFSPTSATWIISLELLQRMHS